MNFDVRTEPWIPVRALSGEKKIFGLEAVLEQAQDLDGMDGLDTMAEYSLYRFLTVFLMTVYRPKSWRDKYRLLEHGSFEANKWKTYIQHCIDEGVSFDIFDVKRPFLQAVPDTGYDLEKNINDMKKYRDERVGITIFFMFIIYSAGYAMYKNKERVKK